ncbi:MAG: hypothetical protein PHE88_09055 [Elusimicrobia bacterium]|nr:hypothetical protein [Elusimicrobiota bacterium]
MNILNWFKCRKVKKILNDYLANGHISAGERNKTESHLSVCSKCSSELAILQKIQNTLKTSEVKKLPVGYTHELHYKLVKAATESRQKVTSNFTLRILYPQLKYAAICLLFFLLIPVYKIYKNKKQTIEPGIITTLNLNQISVFKLRINSLTKVNQATVKVELSNGIRFVKNGQINAGQEEIEWCGDLDKGENIIAIYVIGVKPGNWSINASIKQDSIEKKIKVPFSII